MLSSASSWWRRQLWTPPIPINAMFGGGRFDPASGVSHLRHIRTSAVGSFAGRRLMAETDFLPRVDAGPSQARQVRTGSKRYTGGKRRTYRCSGF